MEEAITPKEDFKYLMFIIHKGEGVMVDVTYHIKISWLKWGANSKSYLT